MQLFHGPNLYAKQSRERMLLCKAAERGELVLWEGRRAASTDIRDSCIPKGSLRSPASRSLF